MATDQRTTDGSASSPDGTVASRTPETPGSDGTRLDRWGAALSDRTDRLPLWVRWAATTLLLLLLATVLVARYAPAHTELSRIDEYVYLDAVDKAMDGRVVRQGDLIDEYTLEIASCQGVDQYGLAGSPCGEPIERELFPYRGGYTSADIHSPVYYFLTAWSAKAVLALGPVDSLLVAARLTGALWLGLGAVLVVALARALGASRAAAGAVAVLVLAAPSVRWTNAFITPDALNLVCGGLILLAAVQYLKGRWSPWVLVLAGALGAAVKAQNLLASALVVVLFAWLALAPGSPEGRGLRWRRVAWAVGGVLAALAAQFGYYALRAAIALEPAPVMDTSAPLSPGVLLQQGRAFLADIVLGPNHRPLVRESFLSLAVSWALVGGLIAAAVFVVGLSRTQLVFARSTLLSIVVSAPALYLMIFVLTGRAFTMPDRYGMVMLPAVAAAAALAARTRGAQAVLLGVGLLGYAFALTVLTLV